LKIFRNILKIVRLYLLDPLDLLYLFTIFNISHADVIIGSQNTRTNTPGQFTLTLTRIIKHPDYIGSLGRPDICLLEIPNLSDSQPDECDNCWSPVCLPSKHVESGRFCYVAGWGTTSFGEEVPTALLNQISHPLF